MCGGVEPQAGCVWGLAIGTEYELLSGADPVKPNLPQHTWCLPRPLFQCAACGANHIVLCCGLTPAIGYAGSGASLERLQCRSMADSVCDWSWATCYYLQSNLQLVATWAGGRGAHERGQAENQGQQPHVPGLGTSTNDPMPPATCIALWLPIRFTHWNSP